MVRFEPGPSTWQASALTIRPYRSAKYLSRLIYDNYATVNSLFEVIALIVFTCTACIAFTQTGIYLTFLKWIILSV